MWGGWVGKDSFKAAAVLCWGEMQELPLFIVLLFGRILGS